MKRKYTHSHITRDLGIIVLSVIISILLVKTGVLQEFMSSLEKHAIISSFIAGMFWVSAFTVVPASVVLIGLAKGVSIFWIAFWGGLGALLADFVMFHFVKDDLTPDIDEIIKHSKFKKIKFLLRFKSFRWLFSLIGAFIIASPLPDEIGIMLMGASKMNSYLFSFFMLILNFIGILSVEMIFRG
jgi:uncharacterized membrane protein